MKSTRHITLQKSERSWSDMNWKSSDYDDDYSQTKHTCKISRDLKDGFLWGSDSLHVLDNQHMDKVRHKYTWERDTNGGWVSRCVFLVFLIPTHSSDAHHYLNTQTYFFLCFPTASMTMGGTACNPAWRRFFTNWTTETRSVSLFDLSDLVVPL